MADGAGLEAVDVAPTVPVVARAPRHVGLVVSFGLVVLAPLAAAALYLAVFAADQYASTVAFSVRSEEAPSPVDLFGGFSGLSGSSSSDTDVLNAFIGSQEMVEAVDAALGLRGLYGAVHGRDPVFGFDPAGEIEDLTAYWQRMVRVSHDAGTGLLEIRVRAFAPEEARAIATEVFGISAALINRLTAIARDDTLRFAEADLEAARDALRGARRTLTAFRARQQIVDPSADVSGQMGLLTRLQDQLAEEFIRADLLREQSGADDPRMAQSLLRISVIEARIADERRKLGAGGAGDDYATLLDAYERLSIEVTFAEEAYASARAAYDLARSEAQRQTRYLAAHIRPTLAGSPSAPDPRVILGVGGLFLGLVWAFGALVFYSLRDRH